MKTLLSLCILVTVALSAPLTLRLSVFRYGDYSCQTDPMWTQLIVPDVCIWNLGCYGLISDRSEYCHFVLKSLDPVHYQIVHYQDDQCQQKVGSCNFTSSYDGFICYECNVSFDSETYYYKAEMIHY